MSKTKSSGTFAENAVTDYMNHWYRSVSVDHDAEPEHLEGYRLLFDDAASIRYPSVLTLEQYQEHPDLAGNQSLLDALYIRDQITVDPNSGKQDWLSQGLPFSRKPSEGSNDSGDVHGPFTAIEVKNYRAPVTSTLLSNAEWKSENAGKLFWLLCYKAAGVGYPNAGMWHAMTTVGHISDAYGLNLDIDQIGEMCYRGDVVRVSIPTLVPGAIRPKYVWSIDLVFTDRMNRMDSIRNSSWNERYSYEDRVVPIVISPRRSSSENYSVPRWYAYSKLTGFARILETMGALPQDESEYH